MLLERESRRGQAPAQLRVQQSLKLQSMKKNNRERHHYFHFKSGSGRERELERCIEKRRRISPSSPFRASPHLSFPSHSPL